MHWTIQPQLQPETISAPANNHGNSRLNNESSKKGSPPQQLMMPFSSRAPVKLDDSEQHGPDSGTELFLVEGDSAAMTVARLRNARLQAVLPMQGNL